MMLNGASAMEGDIDMADNKVENMAPSGTDGNDATKKIMLTIIQRLLHN